MPATAGAFRILVCTGDRGVEQELATALAQRGGEVRVVTDAAGLDTAVAREAFDAVLVDLPASADPGSEWRNELASRGLDGGDVVLAVPLDREDVAKRALGRTAVAYVTKPCSLAQAAAALTIAAENRKLRRRVLALETQLEAEEPEHELIGCSPAMRRLTTAVSRAGGNDATVLIEGKSGVGKSLVARMIHANGRRNSAAIEVVWCDSADEAVLDAALESATGGTLLLEDVDRLPARTQSRLVRFLKDAVGARQVRIVATTSARLAELVAKGAFREDLYYRLNMFPIVVPTLAERREDVPLLAAHFLRSSSRRSGLPDKGFTPAAMILLEAHPWPGNVAQLKNAVARAHALADGGAIDRVHLFGPSTGVHPPPNVTGLTDPIDGVDSDDDVTEGDILPFQEEEKRLLNRALKATRGNVRRAAQLLGIGRATLYRKIQVYKLHMH